MPSRTEQLQDMIISTLRQVSTSTEAIEEKVEVLHPLLKLLRSPDPSLAGYAERIIQLLTSYEQSIQSLEKQTAETKQALKDQSERLDRLLSFLESPAPE